MSFKVDLNSLKNFQELEALLILCKANIINNDTDSIFMSILSSIDYSLLTFELIDNLIEKEIILLEPKDKIYRCLLGLSQNNDNLHLGAAVDIIQEKIENKIRQKYINKLIEDLQQDRVTFYDNNTFSGYILGHVEKYDKDFRKEMSEIE